MEKGKTKMQMVAIGSSIVRVSFEELAHFLIVANQRVDLDLTGLELGHCIKNDLNCVRNGLKSALKKDKNPNYERNMRLLFWIARANCSQFFAKAKDVAKQELIEARCDDVSLIEFCRDQ